MKTKSQREIIKDTSKRFESLVKAGANTNIAYNFYLAILKLDLKSTAHVN